MERCPICEKEVEGDVLVHVVLQHLPEPQYGVQYCWCELTDKKITKYRPNMPVFENKLGHFVRFSERSVRTDDVQWQDRPLFEKHIQDGCEAVLVHYRLTLLGIED